MNKEIKDITCEVKNCKHHDSANHCTANHIVVGDKSATSSTQTECETFECCDDCNCR